MTSSSKRPDAPARPGLYSRFIPREELTGFSAWKPGSFGDDPSLKPQAEPDPELLRREAELAARREAQRKLDALAQLESDRIEALRLSREGGYQDGYRDGLDALENFKQSFASQTSAQVGVMVKQLQGEFDALEQDLAQRLAGIALDLARQVVRTELRIQPALVVAVAQDALSTLLVSARHITLRLHPEDQALVAAGCAELIAVRHVRLVADAQIERGGCRVESDIGVIDASVATRWQRAAAAMGRNEVWRMPDDDAADAAPAGASGGESA
jgi:flagellar assembly protein FliH